MSDLHDDDYEPYLVKRRSSEKKSRTKIFIGLLFLGLLTAAVAVPIVVLTRKPDPMENELVTYNFPYVSRSGWRARKPVDTLPQPRPVPYVVIHHSSTPAACYSTQECVEAMKSMQSFHIDGHHWWDIGYHFGVGSDGVVYEGRGWPILGAHSLHFNNVSVGICIIGDWTEAVPPAEQLKAAKSLLAAGVELGYIKPDYKLVGHRQVRDTECPGQALYSEIQTWEHWVNFPASYMDLANVPELKEDFRREFNRKIKSNI